MKKACIECGEAFVGRADKKFCSDSCRSNHNNRIKSATNTNLVRNINHALGKNRRILMAMNTTGKTKVLMKTLMERGFSLDYHTSTYTTKNGNTYHYCYDQGYLILDDGYVLLVRNDAKSWSV